MNRTNSTSNDTDRSRPCQLRRPGQSKRASALLLRLLLALSLAFGSALSLSTPSWADVRASDLIYDKAVGEGHPNAPDAPDIVADYAALCTKQGIVLWSRDAKASVPMASTTKIMTAVVALENAALDTPMLVTYGAANTDGSTSDLQEGDTTTLGTLIICMMVPSGNDASVAIAENIAGTEIAFVEMMNAKAAQIGMVDTHFSNASGIVDEDNYSTAADYLLLTRAAMSVPAFREAVALADATVEVGGREEEYSSTNALLSQMEGANGVKTGFTDAAGYCLVASAQRNGFELYAVVFHSSDEHQRFVDAEALLEWGFAHYRTVELINAGKPVADLALLSWVDKTVPVVAASPVAVNLFDYAGEVKQEVTLTERDGRVEKGEVVGKVVWTQGGEVIASIELLAADTVPAPDFWEGLSIWWKRFWGGFFGDPPHAKSTTVLPTVYDLKIANVNSN